MPDPDPAAPGQQFMSKQEAEEFIAKAFLQQKLINEQEQKENMRLARQMKIQQETYKYKRPADKRAVRYLLDQEFDLSDMFTQFTSLFQEDGVTLKDEGFVQSFREFSAFMVTWGNMVHRKLMNERESYHVANVSKGGWATEKIYNQTKNSFFKESSKEKKPWYELEDLPPEEKERKMKQAERDNLYNQKSKNFYDRKSSFSNNRASYKDFTKPPPTFTATSQLDSGVYQHQGTFNAVPSRFRYPPKDMSKVICYKCGDAGHYQDYCTKKK